MCFFSLLTLSGTAVYNIAWDRPTPSPNAVFQAQPCCVFSFKLPLFYIRTQELLPMPLQTNVEITTYLDTPSPLWAPLGPLSRVVRSACAFAGLEGRNFWLQLGRSTFSARCRPRRANVTVGRQSSWAAQPGSGVCVPYHNRPNEWENNFILTRTTGNAFMFTKACEHWAWSRLKNVKWERRTLLYHLSSGVVCKAGHNLA